jgi:hypothetical protein
MGVTSYYQFSVSLLESYCHYLIYTAHTKILLIELKSFKMIAELLT